MELRTLRYFLAVAQEKNITRAAENLHVTQPTLSRQIGDLEEELGTTLFVRGKRSLELTEDGALLRQRAQDIVELADRTEHEFAGKRDSVAGNRHHRRDRGAGRPRPGQSHPAVFAAVPGRAVRAV